MLEVLWVSPEVHAAATSAMLAANQRALSLVDCVSFEIMRRMGLHTAFAFNQHFADQGFDRLP